ncbi:hypothetical protein QJQ45_027568 [Haematococcus lacustris]|nr:hypothetical protein QJQ45_027568 [Haematococcus lacustris]
MQVAAGCSACAVVRDQQQQAAVREQQQQAAVHEEQQQAALQAAVHEQQQQAAVQVAAGCSACVAVHEQQQALGCRCVAVHEQQQQAAGVLQCTSSSSSTRLAVLLVAQLETQQKEWGVADKDTRALARQRQAKMKQAHQLVDQLALWEVLGTTQHPNQVSMCGSKAVSMHVAAYGSSCGS